MHISIVQYAKHKPRKREKTGTKPPKPVRVHEDITVLCNQGVRTYREVMETRPNIIIVDKKGL